MEKYEFAEKLYLELKRNEIFKILWNRLERLSGRGKHVYCKIKLLKVAKQKWTLLQVQIGQSCKGCI